MPDQGRRNPFDGVTDYFSELNRMRATGLHGLDSTHHEDRVRTHASAWVPPVDIVARGDDLVITVELAGVAPADVDLRFANGVLTVSGSRATAGDPDDAFYVRERYHGEFRRTVTLPEGVEQEQVSALFEDGLVEVTVAGGAVSADTGRIELQDRSSGVTRRTLG